MSAAVAGLGCVIVSWMWYLALVPAEKVPKRPHAHTALILLGMGLSVVGAVGFAVGPLIVAGVAWLLGGFFLYLLTIAGLPDGELIVKTGDPLPAFSAPDHRGQMASSDDWHGKRILLKFFRGHW